MLIDIKYEQNIFSYKNLCFNSPLTCIVILYAQLTNLLKKIITCCTENFQV